MLSESELKQIGRFGPYTPIAQLGYGGMGVVYYAKTYDGSTAAVKVITPFHANNEEMRKRFKKEIESAKKVNSPNVAKIIDEDLTGDRWWYASEYVPGVTVAQAVQHAGGSLPTNTVRKLVHHIALALQAIHSQGIVHRDLKPQNVMISPNGVKIIDFGIAHSDGGTQLTATDVVVGTPAYMCLEQLQKEQPQAAWDIFALGGLVTYMLTGHPAFDDGGKGQHAMLNAIMRDTRNMDGVPSEFMGLISACLSPTASDRPNASGIHGYLGHEPTAAMPKTLFLPDAVQTAINREDKASAMTALKVQALKPIPRRRKPGESNRDWEARNRTYIAEMRRWNKAERKRMWRTRRAAFRHTAPRAALVLLLAVLCFALGITQASTDWFSKFKEHLPPLPDTAQAAPRTPGSPQYSAPHVTLPGASFNGTNGTGRTSDPDAKDSFIEVTNTEATGYQLTLSVRVTGFAKHGDAPFSESCVRVASGRSSITVHPTAYKAGGQPGVQRIGTIVFSTAFRGTYTFYAECNRDGSVKGVNLGKAGANNQGTIKYQDVVVPVMGSRQQGKDLVVSVIPGSHAATQFCLRSPGITARPSTVIQTQIQDIVFSELTFANAKKGALYTSCSEKNHNVSFHGNGVNVS